MKILFNDENLISTENAEKINYIVEFIGKKENISSKDFEISISFVDNEKIKEMNKFYRDKDLVTDVLSFPQYDSIEEINDEDGYLSLGDIVISLDKVEKQAKEYEHLFERELLYLTTHGMLHLLGYDHINESDKTKMRKVEDDIMKEMDLTVNK